MRACANLRGMALTACAECTREISDSARRCPQCGAPTIAARKSTEMWTRIVGILAVLAVFVAASLLLDWLIGRRS